MIVTKANTRKVETVNVYGVQLTELQEMKFSEWLNTTKRVAPNTISKEERRQLVYEWLEMQEV